MLLSELCEERPAERPWQTKSKDIFRWLSLSISPPSVSGLREVVSSGLVADELAHSMEFASDEEGEEE